MSNVSPSVWQEVPTQTLNDFIQSLQGDSMINLYKDDSTGKPCLVLECRLALSELALLSKAEIWMKLGKLLGELMEQGYKLALKLTGREE